MSKFLYEIFIWNFRWIFLWTVYPYFMNEPSAPSQKKSKGFAATLSATLKNIGKCIIRTNYMTEPKQSTTKPWIYSMGILPDTQNCGLRMRWERRERFPRHRLQRKPLVSDPSMHHGSCVTHMPWCMSRSQTRGGGENVPGIPAFPAHAQPAILRIWSEAHELCTL